MFSIEHLQSLKHYLILQLRHPFPDERPAEMLRIVSREIARLADQPAT